MDNMWRVVIILTSVACCKATVNSSTQAAEVFKITTVPLQNVAPSDSRIIGGNPTTIQKYPYAVQVLYMGHFLCAGSLLTSRHVLSAAHCFVNDDLTQKKASKLDIRAGTGLLNSGGAMHPVSTFVVHEKYINYDNIATDNDVAVVLLSITVWFNVNVGAALLPEQGAEVPDNSTVVAVGWGMTSESESAKVLQEVEVQTIGFKKCSAQYRYLKRKTGDPYFVSKNMICSGLLNVGGKDTCQGDSGGPLIYNGVVVGIISWGSYRCAHPQYPGVSAKISRYITWINTAVSKQVDRYSGGAGVPSAGVAALLTPLLLILCLA